jgi:hypothetical protein
MRAFRSMDLECDLTGRAPAARSPELRGLLFILLGIPRSLASWFADLCLHVGSSGF